MMNRTLPVGVPPLPLTVAVKETVLPPGPGLADESRAVVVRDGASQSFFINGAKDAGSGAGTRLDPKPLGIGNQTQYLDPKYVKEKRSWDGWLDEARVMNVAKDANWIKLEYESQKEGSKFLSFGTTQTR